VSTRTRSARPFRRPQRRGATAVSHVPLAPDAASTGAGTPTERDLESALRATRDELQAAIGELTTANEEMQASTEEALSANEELRSLNDEQSKVNAELDRKIAQLADTNDDLHNLLASTNLATVFLDRTFRIRRFTAAARELFTVIPSDVGRPLAHVSQRFTDPDLLDDAAQVLRNFAPVRREVRTHDDHWYLRETLPYRTRDGRIDGVVITFSDAADEVLREVRVRAEAIVDTVHEGLLVLDDALRVVTANPAFCETFRTPLAALRNQPFLRDDWDVPELRAIVGSVRAGRVASATAELRRAFAHVGERVVLVRARRLKRVGARPALVLLAIDDVTERARQEHALRESEARTRAILAATADGIVTSDGQGLITSWNDAAGRIFGYAAAEVLGRNVAMLVAPDGGDEHGAHVTGTVERHLMRTSAREVVGRRKDATTFPLEFAMGEFDDGKGGGFVAVMRDVTARKRAENEERRHLTELARVLRIRFVGELGVGLAHEMSQPLAAVAHTLEACATRIRSGKATPRTLLRLVENATEQALRAAEIVRTMRELVRATPPTSRDADLRAVIERASRVIRGQLKEQSIDLELALGGQPIAVQVAAVEIEQVVINLLQNAADAISQAPRPCRRRRVRVSAARTADRTVEVIVRDTGPGIREASIDTLFEPFFTTKSDGIGLGLAVCRSIVESHGGRLWVGSHRPGATALHFTLPLVSVHDRPTRPRPPHGR
jgi:two-component system CheB/CheR fusion protein